MSVVCVWCEVRGVGRECDITQLIEIKKGERGRAKAKAANKTGQGKARTKERGQWE